ncbi:MAG TPA: hypothetical protein VK437_03900 [Steroidobacteraceae bacterium]|nr:hypothetical protein [Steroidobacteraceae bacterium]
MKPASRNGWLALTALLGYVLTFSGAFVPLRKSYRGFGYLTPGLGELLWAWGAKLLVICILAAAVLLALAKRGVLPAAADPSAAGSTGGAGESPSAASTEPGKTSVPYQRSLNVALMAALTLMAGGCLFLVLGLSAQLFDYLSHPRE